MKVARLLQGLTAIDRFLHAGVEVLNAHRDAVEPEFLEQIDLLARCDAGIHLDRDLGIRLEREVLRRRLPDPPHLLEIQVRGRPAAPVILGDARPRLEAPRDQIDLPHQVVQVGVRDAGLLRDDDVASAERAPLAAEGKMDVDGERLRPSGRGLVQFRQIALGGERLAELDRGGIGRVARAGAVELVEERRGELGGGMGHAVAPAETR